MKTILVDAVHAFVIKTEDGFKIFESMRKMLDKYPNRKLILTNANDEEFKKFELDKMPYEVFTLKHDPKKVNSEYYKKMLGHFNLKLEDVVYFEHNLEAVKSAQSVGIATYYYDSDKKDLKSLEKYLNKNL